VEEQTDDPQQHERKSGKYAGIVPTPEAYASEIDTTGPVLELATLKDSVVEPRWHIGQVMRAFDDREADDLAVVDSTGKPIGLLTEKYVRRRYAEELERSQRDLFGEH